MNGSIENRIFTTKNGHTYEVICTETYIGDKVWSAVDTIKNNKGDTKKMSRIKTLEFIKS